ncbi:MAG: metalloprotease TldD, partial [Gammaproteobacteria bacterium]|nr:metalloprotease TldD [Gammaproteobacteria bacterium]
MSNLLSQAESRLLQPAELTADGIASVLAQLVSAPGVDAADLYFQHQVSESWVLEDGIVKDGSFNVDQGVGVRAQAGEKTGFAYSNDLHLAALTQAAGAARSIARSGQQGSVQAWQRTDATPLYAADNPLDSLQQAEKVAFLQRLDAYTRSLDPRITQVSVSLGGVHDTMLVAASDGTWAGDVRPLVRLNISV